MPNIWYPNIGGGRHGGIPADLIKDTEVAQLDNYYTFGPKIIRRGGCRPVTTVAASRDLLSLFPYYPSSFSGHPTRLLVGTTLGLGYLDGPGITMLPPATGLIPIAGTRPWIHFQYKDISYHFQPEWGLLLRSDGTYYGQAGLRAPVTAPTLADGGVGVLPAANWMGVFTYYNQETGVESNPSPASAVLALGGTKQIAWSGITASMDPHCNARRLYRVLPNQVNEFYFVHQINNNNDTTYLTDNLLVNQMGRAASYSNGLPPLGLKCGAVWNERLFTSDGVDLFFSELGLVECFDPVLSVISVYPDDGHEIRGIAALGDRLIIGKTNKMHFLLGSGPQTFARYTLSDRHGCHSHHSMIDAEGVLYWFGGDNFYSSDGSSVTPIGDSKIRDLVDLIPSNLYHQVVGWANPTLSQYGAVIPITIAGTVVYVSVVYNYRTASWSTFTHHSSLGRLMYVGGYWDSNRRGENYALFADRLMYKYADPSFNLDGTERIQAIVFSRAIKGASPTLALRRFYISTGEYPGETIDLHAFIDGDSVHSRSGLSLGSRDALKAYNLSTTSRLGNAAQVLMVYEGLTPIEIEGMGFDIDQHARLARQPI